MRPDLPVYPALYNGPLVYFARLLGEERVLLEQYDHYSRQTFRNRCIIAGPNHPITLTVPVKRIRGRKQYFRDVRIDEGPPWRRIHLRSIEASYTASPFFEFVRDDLIGCYASGHRYLIDLNISLLRMALKWLDLDIPLERTSSFHPMTGPGDPRHLADRRTEQAAVVPNFQTIPYHQVFSDRHGFRANLSILDLIFNEGPRASLLLRESLRT